MNEQINKERVNDTAKLIMHRLIARELGRDLSLLDRARISQAKIAERFADRPFVPWMGRTSERTGGRTSGKADQPGFRHGPAAKFVPVCPR